MSLRKKEFKNDEQVEFDQYVTRDIYNDYNTITFYDKSRPIEVIHKKTHSNYDGRPLTSQNPTKPSVFDS